MKFTRLWCVAPLLGILAGAAWAEPPAPWRLKDALGAPEWLTIEGETRVRYETLSGQFRANGTGGDQILALRTLARFEADAGGFTLGVELQDARAYLDDAGTPLSNSLVNPLDVLQAYVRVDTDGAFGWPDSSLTLGRQTLGIGSQRVLERVDMGNVLFSYTGAYWRARRPGEEVHIAAFAPTGRMPSGRDSLADNQLSSDEEHWRRLAFFAQYRRDNLFADAGPGVAGEAYLLLFNERDAAAVPTPDRAYVQPGFRLIQAPRAGAWDFEIEAAWRTGRRRASAAPGETRMLDVNAGMLVAYLGYTFDHPWRPRLALDYYFASGDKNPADAQYGQFERLFGSRRSDLGATGIYGPLTTANIDAPGFRIEIAPDDRTDARLSYKRASIAQSKDAWIDAGLSDPTGASGRRIGVAWDLRVRHWLAPDSLRLEWGASALFPGGFAARAPNSPRPERTLFGYVQLTQKF